jgi:pyruvate/2-oxoglutarate/acetoin dehydrogenase E1 component
LIRRDQLESMERAAAEATGIDCEVISVRSLNPWDESLAFGPAARAHGAVVLHETPLRNGFGAEVGARIIEGRSAEGRGPVLRIGGYDPEHLGTPGPFHVLSRIQQTP